MVSIWMVAYHFSPAGGDGVQRPAKFVKYLPCFGVRPIVLADCGDDASGTTDDPTQVGDCAAAETVRVRLRAWENYPSQAQQPASALTSGPRAFLRRGRPLLARLVCNDGMAGKYDISVGDPWGLPPELDAGAGLSYAIVRTPAGHEAVNERVGAGAISVAEAPSQWVSSRLDMQSGRKARATTARNTYLALFQRVKILDALKGRLRCLPTILRRRLRRVYY